MKRVEALLMIAFIFGVVALGLYAYHAVGTHRPVAQPSTAVESSEPPLR